MLNVLIAAAAIHRLAGGARQADGLPVLIASGTAAVVMLVAR